MPHNRTTPRPPRDPAKAHEQWVRWYAVNREVCLQKKAAKRAIQPDPKAPPRNEAQLARHRENERKYRASNPDHARALQRLRRLLRPELAAEWSHKSRNKRLSYYREKAREWRKGNPGRYAEIHRNSERRRIAAKRGNISEPIRERTVIERDCGICHICRKPISAKDMTLDHLVPVSKGGANTEWNLRPAHRRCNAIRSNRGPAQLLLPM